MKMVETAEIPKIDELEITARLRASLLVLHVLDHELRDLAQSLPASPQETSTEDWEDSPAGRDELYGVLGSVLHDRLAPLLADLKALVQKRWQPKAPGTADPARDRPREPEVCRKLDLAASEEEMRAVVYALVARDNFAARPSDEEPGEVWLRLYTPEQAGLRVWKKHGRWYAAWRKLEVPDEAPEDERWEVLHIEEDSLLHGSLVYREIQPG